jgi:aminomethyltransferase
MIDSGDFHVIVVIRDDTDTIAALALQGPLSRAVLEATAQTSLAELRYFRRQQIAVGAVTVDVSRTGYTGDLGYELWVERGAALALWDALMETGAAHALRPAGIMALDVTRVEAGLIMAEVDYTSSRHALTPDQSYSPYEVGLGRLVKLDKDVPFVGRRALRAEQDAGGPPRRLVGLDLDWDDLAALYTRHGLAPAVSGEAWRDQIPVYGDGGQVERATSGTWSLVLKKNIAIGTFDAASSAVGTDLQMEWSVEGERGRIGARVVELPFFDPPRKRE